ncbi:MAG: GNAT family N-acetyltransferase [Actinomycetota bacterium]
MDWRVDHYRPGDEHAILALFRAAFGEERSLALWRWRYGELPGGTDNILLVRDENGALCGHYAGLPFTIVFRGREIPGALRLDLMIHPDRQRMGIGLFLIESMRQHMKGRISLVTSFPNDKSTGPTIKKSPHYLGEAPLYWRLEDISSLFKGMGWTAVPARAAAAANVLLRAAYRLIAMPSLRDRRYGHVERRGFEDGLSKDGYPRDGCGIHFKRDEAFLRWRFDRHPEMDYTVIFLDPKVGGDTKAGYIVLTVMGYEGFRIGFIVDILVHPLSLRPARYLVAQAARWFEARGVETISCMMTGRNAYSRALRSLGFFMVSNRFMPRDLNLSFRVLDPDLDFDHATDPMNWVLTWADTDLV